MARVQSSGGSAQHYGPRAANTGLDNSVSTYGVVSQRELRHDYLQANAGLPTSNADDDAGVLVIPANSLIVAAYYQVGSEAYTSGGSATLQLGLALTDGTVVDSDGLDSIPVASLTANSSTVCDGALVGASVGTADVQIRIVDAVAEFTAGSGRLIVEYIVPYV